MRPFDLEEARNGSRVVTRAGDDVEILSFDGEKPYPILGYIRALGLAATWTECGIYSTAVYCIQRDLFMGEIKREGWVNVLHSKLCGYITSGAVHASKAKASENVESECVGPLEFVGTAKIIWYE